MWTELQLIIFFLYMNIIHNLKNTYTYLTEDKNAFIDFHLNHTKFEGLFQHHVTVEVAVVCSKDFADNFYQDKELVKDYVTAYFWDISSRFRTLHQNKISFSVTSLTIIKSKEEQPFIENVPRDSKDGHTSLAAILPLFQKWISSKSSHFHLPGFDVAMLFTEPILKDGKFDRGAVAEFEGACHEFKSAIVLHAGNMTAAMLELANLVGAKHKTQCDYPHILQSALVRGLKKDLKAFFSFCADVQITDFVRSPKSSCLHTAHGSPIIDPDFDSALPPSITEQCRFLSGSRNATAVSTEAGNECALTRCILPRKGGWGWFRSSTNSVLITPLANSRCGGAGGEGRGGGRCFQGRCLSSVSLLTNVGTGMCLHRHNSTSQLYGFQSIKLDRCARSAAPFEMFQVLHVNSGKGKMLKMPCQALAAFLEGTEMEQYLSTEYTFKCLDMCLTLDLNYWLELRECDDANAKQRWEFREMDTKGEFLLYNVGTKKCSFSFLNEFQKFKTNETLECDRNNKAMLWKMDPVLPGKTCPDAADNCFNKAQLSPQLSFQVLNSTHGNLLILNVSLHNLNGGMAVAPGVIVSWRRKSNITLTQTPENCFPFPPHPPSLPPSPDGDVNSLKCKLGRLMQNRNETTLVATLKFNATFNPWMMHNLPTNNDFQEAMGFSVIPTMASLINADTSKGNQKRFNEINHIHNLHDKFIK